MKKLLLILFISLLPGLSHAAETLVFAEPVIVNKTTEEIDIELHIKNAGISDKAYNVANYKRTNKTDQQLIDAYLPVGKSEIFKQINRLYPNQYQLGE